MRTLIYALAVLALAASASCTYATGRSIECREIKRQFFFGKTPQERVTAFKKQKLEDKYRIYRCGMETMHPSLGELVKAFAQEGSAAVPLLQRKLSEVDKDWAAANIIEVFFAMDVLGTYDVSANRELMRAMAERIDGLDEERARSVASNLYGRLVERGSDGEGVSM